MGTPSLEVPYKIRYTAIKVCVFEKPLSLLAKFDVEYSKHVMIGLRHSTPEAWPL
jgi:hypothetical protein